MGTVRYTTINGEIIAEKRNGVRSLYVPDPLGSTVALLDNTQTQTDTFSYWPYGEVNSRTGTTPTPFQFVGTAGYYTDGTTRDFVRARTLNTQQGRWMSKDPIGFGGDSSNVFVYVLGNPLGATDPSGMQRKPPPPDVGGYGWYCGAHRTPYPDAHPGMPRKDRRRQKPPLPPIDSVDACCQQHDFDYWCHDCQDVRDPNQTDYCHNLDVALCNCWKKADCGKRYPPGKDRDDCKNFKKQGELLCKAIRLHGKANEIEKHLPKVR